MQKRRNVRFDKRFDKFDRNINRGIKGVTIFAVIVTVLQILLLLACTGGVIYFIFYACTHWIKW